MMGTKESRIGSMEDSAGSSAGSPGANQNNNHDGKTKSEQKIPNSVLANLDHIPPEVKEEILKLRSEAVDKAAEIERLSRIREDVEAELEELTASLFQEAHKMVHDANLKHNTAEKLLVEARMKIDGLETEVAALKTLVLTSTPSNPNPHLHPQIDPKLRKNKMKLSGLSSSPGSPNKAPSPLATGSPGLNNSSGPSSLNSTVSNDRRQHLYALANGNAMINGNGEARESCQDQTYEDSEDDLRLIDPALRKEYVTWRKNPTMDRDDPFIARIYREDVDRCLAFDEKPDLALAIRKSAEENTICIAPVKDFSDVPRNCGLLDAPVLCKYTLKLDVEGQNLTYISHLGRNRIIAVCDCLNYLRYVVQGLVKSRGNDVYWEIIKLRRKMSLAVLGYNPE